jgi:hypothetical protein
MKHILWIFLFVCNFAFANEVKVEINPRRPVAGEVFQAHFRIFTDFEGEPVINFSPWEVEVVGKSNQGVSTRTIYANGRLTVTREITYVYDLVASKPGAAGLRDITIQLGDKTIPHASVSVSILKEAEEPQPIFVMADVPKKSVYVGEGIIVRYYIYSRVPFQNLDIKKYPKLDSFLKRFLQEPDRVENVSVNGELFQRTSIYSVKLYPEKKGVFKIDPLHLSVRYIAGGSADPFGAFGLNREVRSKSFSSESVSIEVKPLPEPIPPHFSGLVGKHDFSLDYGQSRLIVNEPLELKLTVSGVGALENLEAPQMFKNPGLEEFEVNGELKILNADHATKVFDYTYLAKENLTIPARDLQLSYLDPDQGRYVVSTIKVPEVVVAGGGQPKPQVKNDVPSETPDDKSVTEPSPVIKDFSAPVSVDTSLWRKWLPVANTTLAVTAILFGLFWGFRHKAKLPLGQSKIPASFRRGQFDLGEFVRWLSPAIAQTGKSPLLLLKDSPLSPETKRYFIDLLTANDYKDYSTRKSDMAYTYQAGHFKELGSYIESMKNESPSQSS